MKSEYQTKLNDNVQGHYLNHTCLSVLSLLLFYNRIKVFKFTLNIPDKMLIQMTN